MFLHYLKIAWRNLLKHKTQSIISVLGLTIGVVFFAYGYHWYKFETTYDEFYPNADRIYKVFSIYKSTGKQYEMGTVPYIAVEKLQQAFPEIEKVAVQYPNYSSGFKYNDKELGYPSFEFVDEHFFSMFPPNVIAGTIDENTLKNNNEIVLTESFAREHIGTPDKALGEILVSGYNKSYVVKAVIANPPANSIFKRVGYLPDTEGRTFQSQADDVVKWRDFNDTGAFFLLRKGTDTKKFREKLRTFAIDNNYNDDLLFGIVPLTSVRHTISNPFDKVAFDIKYIWTFILSALLLIFAAFFNYLNILINTIFTRVREMNLRRVTGASTANIFGQIVVEMLLLIVVVLLFSFCALELTIPVFEKTFSTVIITGKIYGILLVTICVVSALIYLTAFVFLSRFIRKTSFRQSTPAKNKFSSNRISLTLQLIISMFFILSAFVLYRQVQFMHNADWGFNKNHLLQIKLELKDREPFMDNVKKLPMVKNVISTSFFTVIQNMDNMGATRVPGVEWEGKPMDYSPVFQTFSAEKNFITDMGITLRMGRDFAEEDLVGRAESNKIIINETAQRVMEMDNPIGKKITVHANWFTQHGRGKDEFEIIGVVKDFHTIALQSEVPPLIIKGMNPAMGGYYNYVRVVPGTENDAVKAINELALKHQPDDKNKELAVTMESILSDLSKTEQDVMKLFFTVAALCVLIAVFGIYSVSQRETQRRRKEIAIRKTAGAKTKEIMTMFFREYLIITGLASVVALPLAWLFMEGWLQSFAYRISISWWMFVMVALVVCAIVLLTIFSQVHKASNQNPAEVVKSE
ncbi:MAG: ABC transporter permease [Proteiniphilum sp.]|nr:ABC transporter permease [Proteiniphilum sp.]MDD4415354.1 ABC transporter permease [Proteiniphilum sp.]